MVSYTWYGRRRNLLCICSAFCCSQTDKRYSLQLADSLASVQSTAAKLAIRSTLT